MHITLGIKGLVLVLGRSENCYEFYGKVGKSHDVCNDKALYDKQCKNKNNFNGGNVYRKKMHVECIKAGGRLTWTMYFLAFIVLCRNHCE